MTGFAADDVAAMSWVSADALIMEDNAGAIRWHYQAQTEPHERTFEVFSHFPGEDEFFLDVGANIGNSVVSFRLFNKRARMFSLEPLELLRPALDAVKAIEGDRFDFRMVAAGASESTETLFIPSADRHPVFYLASFDAERFGPDPARIAGTRGLMGRPLTERYGVTKLPVAVIRIDSLGLKPTLVKIDAEGHELPVLIGMQNTIAAARPLFLVEGGNGNRGVASFMQERGYRFAIFADGAMQLAADGDEDGFFLADERLDQYRQIGALR